MPQAERQFPYLPSLATPEILPSFLVFTDPADGLIKVKNGLTGVIDHSGNDASTEINWALTHLTVGRTSQEMVAVKGVYTTNKIRVPSYTLFDISSAKLTLADGVNDNLIENFDLTNGNTDITIVGGCLDGNKANQTAGHGIYFYRCTNAIVDRVKIANAKVDGIRLNANAVETLNASVTNCRVTTCDGNGIVSYNGQNKTKIAFNVVEANGGAGIYLFNCYRFLVTRNTCGNYESGNNRHGIEIQQCYKSIVSSNTCIFNVVSNGIYCHDPCIGLIIADNNVHGNGEWGIYCSADFQDGVIDGNYIADNSLAWHSNFDEIYVAGHDNIISDNILLAVVAPDRHGIFLDGAVSCVVAGNRRYGTASCVDGIRLTNANTNLIDGNIISNNDGIDLNIVSGTGNRIGENNVLLSTTKFADGGTNTVLPSLTLPFVDGTLSVTADGAPKGWSIALATNFAITYGVMPAHTQQTVRIRVWAVGLAAPGVGNQMLIDLTANGGQPDEVYTGEAISVTSKESNETNFAINDIITWTFTVADDADIGHLVAGDCLEIKLIYRAAGAPDIATNALLRCVEIQYV